MNKLTRHDYTGPQQSLLRQTVALGLADPVDVGILIANHRLDFQGIIDEVTEDAYAAADCLLGQDVHERWVAACDAYHAYHLKGETP